MVKIAWDLLLALWICVAAVILERRTNHSITKAYFPVFRESKKTQIQQINEDEGIWNLENTVGCVLGSDHSVFGRGPGRVETKDHLEVFLSTSSTLKKYLKAALQHRYQVLHKGRTQQRTTASNSIVELIPNTTECTGWVHFLHIVPIFISWHFKGSKKLCTPLLGLPSVTVLTQ